jgi:hypothetical protein
MPAFDAPHNTCGRTAIRILLETLHFKTLISIISSLDSKLHSWPL